MSISKNVKWLTAAISLISIPIALGILAVSSRQLISPRSLYSLRQRNLSKYKFEALARTQFTGNQIVLKRELATTPRFTAYLFHFRNQEGKLISGQLNVPRVAHEPKIIIVLLRGYVDKQIYKTGMGTAPAAGYFASQGLFTVSPDFLGYGDSDSEPNDILESRFEKPATVLSLLASLDNFPTIGLPNSSSAIDLTSAKLGLWGHSNGGQIALSVLEINQQPIPTTLWAPVSIGFPESITNFLEELPDRGDYIRKDLTDFGKRYDFGVYSISNYFHLVRAPVILHQGGRDDAVPETWSQNLANHLHLLPGVNYYYYPEADHNMRPDWNRAIARDLSFFLEHLDNL